MFYENSFIEIATCVMGTESDSYLDENKSVWRLPPSKRRSFTILSFVKKISTTLMVIDQITWNGLRRVGHVSFKAETWRIRYVSFKAEIRKKLWKNNTIILRLFSQYRKSHCFRLYFHSSYFFEKNISFAVRCLCRF